MYRLLALFLLIPFAQTAQTVSDHRDPGQEIYKVNHWYGSLNVATHAFNNPAWSHGLEAMLNGRLNNNWTLSAQSFLSLGNMDYAHTGIAKETNKEIIGNAKLLPYNQTAFTAIRRLNFLNRPENNPKVRRFTTFFDWGVRTGYFYTQESLHSSGGRGYYQLYAAPEGNGFISGYRAHTGTIGLDYTKTVISGRFTRIHHAYADLLIGFQLAFSGYQQNADGSYTDIDVKDNFTRDRLGTRIGYEFRWFGKKGFGFLLGAESQIKPNIHYHHNSNFYTVRGGERYYPLNLIAKIGLAYRF